MRDKDIETRRDLMIARACEAQEYAALAHQMAINCLNADNWDFNVPYNPMGELFRRSAQWQNTAKLAHDTQAECVQCLLHMSKIWLDQSI